MKYFQYKSEEGKYYLINPYDKIWRYFLLSFSWIIPCTGYIRKGTQYTRNVRKKRNKATEAIAIGIGVSLGPVIFSVLKQIRFSVMIELNPIVMTVLTYVLCVFGLLLIWNGFAKLEKRKRTDVSKDEKIRVRFRITSIKSGLFILASIVGRIALYKFVLEFQKITILSIISIITAVLISSLLALVPWSLMTGVTDDNRRMKYDISIEVELEHSQ